MQAKYIKPVLLIIFIFCSLSSMASKKECRMRIASDLAGYDSREKGIDDHFSGSLIFNKFSTATKPARLNVVGPGDIYHAQFALNISDQPEIDHVISGGIFKISNQVLLFPFHGFW